MRSPWGIVVVMAGLFLGAAFVGSRVVGGDDDYDFAAADPPPNIQPVPSSPERFFASDQRLLQDGVRAIREKAVHATGKGQSGVPYYIELVDGRYAFGRTDAFGNTRPLFTDGPIAHKVHWDDEALSRTKAAIAAPPEPSPPVVTKDPVERWKETIETLGSRRRTTIGHGSRCVIATSGDSPIAKACALGGRQRAKQEMKKVLAVARANGKKFTCTACHQQLDSYALTDNARSDFPTLLTAANVGTAGN